MKKILLILPIYLLSKSYGSDIESGYNEGKVDAIRPVEVIKIEHRISEYFNKEEQIRKDIEAMLVARQGLLSKYQTVLKVSAGLQWAGGVVFIGQSLVSTLGASEILNPRTANVLASCFGIGSASILWAALQTKKYAYKLYSSADDIRKRLEIPEFANMPKLDIQIDQPIFGGRQTSNE